MKTWMNGGVEEGGCTLGGPLQIRGGEKWRSAPKKNLVLRGREGTYGTWPRRLHAPWGPGGRRVRKGRGERAKIHKGGGEKLKRLLNMV